MANQKNPENLFVHLIYFKYILHIDILRAGMADHYFLEFSYLWMLRSRIEEFSILYFFGSMTIRLRNFTLKVRIIRKGLFIWLF